MKKALIVIGSLAAFAFAVYICITSYQKHSQGAFADEFNQKTKQAEALEKAESGGAAATPAVDK